jgi:predicted DNA-binding transcriptional regulator AlpA
MDNSPTLPSPEAAQYIGMSDAWLRKSRMNRDPLAPPFLQIGKSVRYLRADLDNWLASRRVDHGGDMVGKPSDLAPVHREHPGRRRPGRRAGAERRPST